MVGILKRSREEMEAGNKGTLQNPEHQDVENPRKKQMLDVPNGVSTKQELDIDKTAKNGVHANGNRQEVPTQGHVSNTAAQDIGEPFQPLPKITEGWIPFSRVISRTAQEVQNELLEVLESLSGSPLETLERKVERKDVIPHSDFLRRQQLWDFAHKHRGKLIKLLVLSYWSHHSEEVSGLIDIKVWLDMRRALYRESTDWIGELRRIAERAKMPQPDLSLALETLSSGRADWISDLGYSPKKPPTAEEMLESMQEINAILVARLSLHDTIPDAFRNFTIKDARATFTVEDEFEVSLSVGSDKPEDQLYFIDFRFCFSPAEQKLPDELMAHLQYHMDRVLAKDGLQGCYEYLHNFTLTHKLNIFKTQAMQLLKTRWGDSIKVEPVHRALVVQYWTNRPGRKSWIEIGMKKRRTHEELLDANTLNTSHLALRWHRQGKEVFDHGLEIDVEDLSLESILKDTIAAHTNTTFASTEDNLRSVWERHSASLSYDINRRSSLLEPAECALDITFPDGLQITLNQEPLSGRFAILPRSPVHARFEESLNRSADPSADMVRQLLDMRALSASERHSRTALLAGWQEWIDEDFKVKDLRPETIGRTFGPDIYKFKLYRPPATWAGSWLLCISHHTPGEDIWRLVQLRDKSTWRGEPTAVSNWIGSDFDPFGRAFKICAVPRTMITQGQDTPQFSTPSPYQLLRWVLSQGAAVSSRAADMFWLRNPVRPAGKKSFLRPLSAVVRAQARQALTQGTTTPFVPVAAPELALDLRVMKSQSVVSCYERKARSIIDGVNHNDGHILTSTLAKLNKALPLGDQSLYFEQGSIRIGRQDNKILCLNLRTPIGTSSVTATIDRLSGFSRIATCVNDLRRMGLYVETFDLKQITASIGPLIRSRLKTRGVAWADRQFRVYFSCDENGPTGVTFDPSGPYYRLRAHFNDYLEYSNGRFQMLARELCMIAPALFTVCEQSQQSLYNPWVAIPEPRRYIVRWGLSGGCQVGYEIRFAHADGEPCWRLSFLSTQDANRPEAVQKIADAWSELCRTRGEGFEGLGTEIKVDMDQAAAALWHILDTFVPHVTTWYEELSSESPAPARKEPVTTANGTAQQSGAQGKPKSPNEKRKDGPPGKKENRQVITIE